MADAIVAWRLLTEPEKTIQRALGAASVPPIPGYNFFIKGYISFPPEPSPYYPVEADCILYHAYWDGSALDHSIYANNGTLMGATHLPTFGTYGLTFDGTEDYVALSPLTYDRNTMTIWAWVLPTGTSGRQWVWASMDLAGNPGLEYAYYSAILGAFDSAYPGNYVMQMNRGAGLHNVWSLISFSRNGAGATSEVFVNSDGPKSLLTNANLTLATGAKTASIGRRTTADSPFKGTIGEILLFTSYKNSTAISAYYNATKARYGL